MKALQSIFFALVVVGVSSFSSCKEDEETDSEYIERAAAGESIFLADTVSIINIIEWKIKIGTPNPCHIFSRASVSTELNKTSVSLYTKYKKGENCILITGVIDTIVNIKPTQLGQNILTLNPNTNFEIVDTIFVTN